MKVYCPMIADKKNKTRIRLTSTGLLDYRTKISLYNLVHRRIGKTTVGLNDLASSKSIMAYDMIITMSPTCTFRAAAPFRQIHPEPRSPFNNISFKPLAVIIIHNVHFLAGNHVGGIHQVLVNRNTTHVIQIGFVTRTQCSFDFNTSIIIILMVNDHYPLYFILSIKRTSPQNTVMQPTA